MCSSQVGVIAVIVLAAGASTRLGQPKQLLDYRGKTLLRHALDTAISADIGRVYAVLGAHADLLIAECDGVRVVVNDEWHEGIASSIKAGLSAALADKPDLEALAICLVDQPAVDVACLQGLVNAWRESRDLVASEYGDTIGVPALFGRSYFAEIAALAGDRGAKAILARHVNRVAKVSMPEAKIDIDTIGDYAAAIELANPSVEDTEQYFHESQS